MKWGKGAVALDNLFKEKLAYYDRPKQCVTIHYHFNGEKVLKLFFNFAEDGADLVDGCLRDYLPMSAKEEADFLLRRRQAAWKRLCEVPIH